MAEDEGNRVKKKWGPGLLLLAFLVGVGLTTWLFYDGFISDKFADSPGTLWFNRIGAPILVLLSIRALVLMTMRSKKAPEAPAAEESSGEGSPRPPAEGV